MYDELVKRLRAQADAERYFVGESMLYDVAADAIEELSASVEGFEAQTNMVLDRDGNNTVIRFEPRWISVQERLPEEDGDYLVWFYDAACCKVCEFNKHTAKGRHVWWFAGIDRTRFVTHWMHIQQPPEEEE